MVSIQALGRALGFAAMLVCLVGRCQAQVGSGGSVSPSSGTFSPGQPITFTVTGDGTSAQQWESANSYLILNIGPSSAAPTSWTGQCQLQYQPYTYTVFQPLNNTQFQSAAVPSNTVLSNSQCLVNLGAASTGVTDTMAISLTVSVTFSSSFTGTQYLYLGEDFGSGITWYLIGSITVGGSTQVAAPIFSPGPGSYASVPEVSMTSVTAGATIRYTADGTTPTETWGTVYNGPVSINSFTTLKAIAYESGWTDSAITTGVYSPVASLPSTLTVTDSPLASKTYAANSTVINSASANVTTASGGSTLFEAGSQITLVAPFSTVAGSYFHAKIGSPDYILSAAPASGYTGSVTAGNSTEYTITASSVFGFTGSVQLSTNVAGLPPGATVTFGSTTLSPSSNGSASTTMTVNTVATGPGGSYTPAVSGTSGSVNHSGNLSLSVAPASQPNFQFSVNTLQQAGTLGFTASYTFIVTPQSGFASSVQLGVAGLPQGMSFQFSNGTGLITGGSGSVTLMVNTSGGSSGTYSLTVTATAESGGLTPQSITVYLTANGPSFQLSLTSSSSQTVQLGSSAQYTVSVTPQNGFTGSVSLAVTQLQQGMTWSASPNPITGGSGTATITINTAAGGPTGTFNFTITGTSGNLSGSVFPTLVVNGPPTTTVTTAPGGQSFTVDGTSYATTQNFQWTSGSVHTIAIVTNPQPGATGTQYVFANWSDGGAISHTITVGSASAVYTASFTTQYYLTTAASPASEGSIQPAPPGAWYNSGTVVAVSATANSGDLFSGFTGALSGTTSPQNVTMNGPLTVTANFGTFYTISGSVTSGGCALAGVTMTLAGSQGASTSTNSQGSYSFSVPAGSYTVTPSLTGDTFSPANASFTNLSANQTANFIVVGTPSREYIRLGSQVIAIANCGAP